MPRYPYHDPSGVEQYAVQRARNKQFTMHGASHVRYPYRLPELLQACEHGACAFIVEGEKDADNLARVISPPDAVTTSAGGAAWQWPNDWQQWFKGLNAAYVLADNDDVGRKAAVQRAQAIADVVPTVTVLMAFPGVAEHGDVTDWLNNGGNVQQLWRLVQGAPDVHSLALEDDGSARIASIADVEVQPVEWLWPGWLAYGKLALLDGDPSLGKSTVALTLAACVTTGNAFPDQMPGQQRQPGNVLILSAEDGPGDTIKPRLLEAGADTRRVFLWQGVRTAEGHTRLPHFPEDAATFERIIKQHRIKFSVIDVLSAYTGGRGMNSFADADVRNSLAPLMYVAERQHVSVLALRHLNKSGGSNAMYRGGGSIAIIGAARHAYIVAPDPRDTTNRRRIIACVKNNLAPKPTMLAYSIIEGNDYNTARVHWQEQVDDLTLEDLLREAKAQEGESTQSALETAVQWLSALLSDGPKPSVEVLALAELDGLAEKTLRRAKTVLHVEARQQQGGWFWTLPD